MRHDIDQLNRQLDAPDTVTAEEAKAELAARGRTADVVVPLVAALPRLGRCGQLCAIEILDDLATPAPSVR